MTFRGQPLLLLVGLLAGWVSLRVAFWEPTPEPRAAETPAATHQPRSSSPIVSEAGFVVGPTKMRGRRLPAVEREPKQLPPPAFLAASPAVPAPVRFQAPPPGIPAAAPFLASADLPELKTLPTPRWSADGWIMLRDDTTTPFLPGAPTYGRSQAGAVLRYHLRPTSPLRPQIYLRASTALAGARERELAAGMSARLLPGVPLRLAAEARASETAYGTRFRPAGYAVTELPPVKLPFGARGEAYLQGGYVGGDFATAFVDGQARLDRPLTALGETEASVGVAAWGGAQKGAARLDVGPTAAVTFRLGDARGRIAADYRFHVAGDAEPASGPALTVSAGF